MGRPKKIKGNYFVGDMDGGGVTIEPPPDDWDDGTEGSPTIDGDKLKAFRDEVADPEPE